MDAIPIPRDAIEAFRKTEPLFTEFLIESGRVVVTKDPKTGAHGQIAGRIQS
jgi:hypothetical protein